MLIPALPSFLYTTIGYNYDQKNKTPATVLSADWHLADDGVALPFPDYDFSAQTLDSDGVIPNNPGHLDKLAG